MLLQVLTPLSPLIPLLSRYFLPEFFGERARGTEALVQDFASPGITASMGGGAYEWNTMQVRRTEGPLQHMLSHFTLQPPCHPAIVPPPSSLTTV